MPGQFLPMLAAQTATTSANSAVGGIFGAITGKWNDKRQLKQQGKLQDLQIKGSKELTDYNFQKQLQMWKDTGYEAQMKQLKEAGLNPGLIYGMSGGGGQTTGSGSAQTSGATASQAGGNEYATGLGLALGSAKQAAEIKLLEAQAKLAETEATKKAGVDTKLAETQISSLTQGIDNQKSTKILTDAQSALTQLEAKWQETSWKTREKILVVESQKMVEEYEMLARDNMINREVAEERIQIVERQALQIMLQNESLRTGITLDKAKTEEIYQSIKTQIKQLQQGDRQLNQKDKELLIQEIRNDLIETGIWVGAASNIAGTAVDIFTKGKGKSITTNNNIYTRPVVEKKP